MQFCKRLSSAFVFAPYGAFGGFTMNIGENIKKFRLERGISAERLAGELGVSKTTVYRYENSSIEKIPLKIFDKICDILSVSPAELMGNATRAAAPELPPKFYNAQDAMEFILKTPTLAAFGGYDPSTMDEQTILEFANEILQQLKLVSYKYRNIH